jgi:hypothetical protein
VTDKEKEKDWDKEMREVDRLLARLPAADPGLVSGAKPTLKKPIPAATSGTHSHEPTGMEWLGSWARVALGMLIGAGMTQWPYAHGCGLNLLLYGVGVGAVLAAGIWSSVAAWKHRLVVAHLLSQLLIIWALVLAAGQILPRVGYAREQGVWLCPDVALK